MLSPTRNTQHSYHAYDAHKPRVSHKPYGAFSFAEKSCVIARDKQIEGTHIVLRCTACGHAICHCHSQHSIFNENGNVSNVFSRVVTTIWRLVFHIWFASVTFQSVKRSSNLPPKSLQHDARYLHAEHFRLLTLLDYTLRVDIVVVQRKLWWIERRQLWAQQIQQ